MLRRGRLGRLRTLVRSRRTRVRDLGFVLATGFALAAVGTLPGTAADTTNSETVLASADAYVKSSDPSTNFGSADDLFVDSAPNEQSNAGTDRTYIRFDIPASSAPLAHATLGFYGINGDTRGFTVGVASGDWDEHTITWETAPSYSESPSVDSGPFSAGSWVALDVTPLITSTGTVTFVLTSSSPPPMALASREQGDSVAPRLSIETAVTAPVNETPPAISGQVQEGQPLTAAAGVWSGTEPISYGYQWRRCDSTGASCVDIADATGTTYTPTSEDVDKTLVVEVTASNSAGSSTASSAPTALIAAVATDTSPPGAPADLMVSAADQSSLTLSWSASSDNVAVAGYDLYLNGSRVASTGQTSYRFGGLSCGTGYTLGVAAFDAAGNHSQTSTLTSATAPCPTGASNPCGTVATPPATYHHVVWIVFENHSYSEIIGAPSAPYINTLAIECGVATNSFAETHPSLPNYIAMTSGSTQGITDDNPPSSHQLSGPSVFSQVDDWRSLEESMPSNCDLTDAYPYAVKHNPAAYYTGIRTACGTLDVPLASAPDISATFTFVTPNMCNDMHDCSVSTGDSWLSTFLPKILNSSAYTSGDTAIFITWDEDDSSEQNHIATLVISPSVPLATSVATTFNHYSMLRTTEELLGFSTYLGNAATAPSMRSAFHF
jgi:phosphatidylinositol-3-phosphatase